MVSMGLLEVYEGNNNDSVQKLKKAVDSSLKMMLSSLLGPL